MPNIWQLCPIYPNLGITLGRYNGPIWNWQHSYVIAFYYKYCARKLKARCVDLGANKMAHISSSSCSRFVRPFRMFKGQFILVGVAWCAVCTILLTKGVYNFFFFFLELYPVRRHVDLCAHVKSTWIIILIVSFYNGAEFIRLLVNFMNYVFFF